MKCGVAGCGYLATESLEGFPSCELHARPQTLAILQRFKRPGAFFFQGHPVVLPSGPLKEEHFFIEGGRPLDYERLAELVELPGFGGLPVYDLFKDYPEIL